MSRLYGEQHRKLQDQFDARRLADLVEAVVVKSEIGDDDKAFIESRDMFFLATADHTGRPTVSYKGGDPGFVRVLDPGTIAFPSYDGNGMFLSLGNIAGNSQVGLLFVNFENPNRVRVQGTASASREDPLLSEYHEADMIVRVRVSEVFPNCPRYVHRYQKVSPSRYVPRADCATPIAGWKRIDQVQDSLPARDAAKAKAAGQITMEEWGALAKSGDPQAGSVLSENERLLQSAAHSVTPTTPLSSRTSAARRDPVVQHRDAPGLAMSHQPIQ